MFKYVFFILGSALIINSLAMANDYVNAEAAKKGQVLEAGRWYKAGTGKEPTLNNLLKSIQIEEGNKDKSLEARAALDVLLLMDPKTTEIAEKVIKCYNAYQNNWNIRLVCGEYLIKVNNMRDKGIEFLRLIIREPKVNLDTKLLAAASLVEIGNLEGYPLVREGLVSNFTPNRILATDLLRQLIPYDSKPFNSKGDKIDINKLIESVKGETLPETFTELQKIRKELKK